MKNIILATLVFSVLSATLKRGGVVGNGSRLFQRAPLSDGKMDARGRVELLHARLSDAPR